MAIVPQQIEVGFPFTVADAVIMGRSPHLGILGMEGENDFHIAEEAMKFTEVVSPGRPQTLSVKRRGTAAGNYCPGHLPAA